MARKRSILDDAVVCGIESLIENRVTVSNIPVKQNKITSKEHKIALIKSFESLKTFLLNEKEFYSKSTIGYMKYAYDKLQSTLKSLEELKETFDADKDKKEAEYYGLTNNNSIWEILFDLLKKEKKTESSIEYYFSFENEAKECSTDKDFNIFFGTFIEGKDFTINNKNINGFIKYVNYFSKDTQDYITSSIKPQEEMLANLQQRVENLLKETSEKKEEIENNIDKLENKKDNIFKSVEESKIANEKDIRETKEKLEKIHADFMALKKPADYYHEQAKFYKKKAKNANLMFFFLFTAFLFVECGFIYVMVVCKKPYFFYPMFITVSVFFGLIIWFIKGQIITSEKFMNECFYKEAIIYTYLSLQEQENIDTIEYQNTVFNLIFSEQKDYYGKTNIETDLGGKGMNIRTKVDNT